MPEYKDYPQGLLDLIAEKEFALLSDMQKELVLRYMAASEYDEMHKTWTAVSQTEGSAVNTAMPGSQITEAIFQRFRANKRPSPISSLLQTGVPLWQAAAVLLIAIGLTLFLSPRKELVVISENAATTDTVVVEKQVEKTKYIWDTVYIARASEQKTAPKNPAPDESRTEAQEPRSETYMVPSMQGLSILRMDEARQLPSGGKSLGDDSMARNFNYVTL